MLVGIVAGGVLLLSLIAVWRSLRSDEEVIEAEPGTPPEMVAAGPAARVKPSPAAMEAEAKKLLLEARDAGEGREREGTWPRSTK